MAASTIAFSEDVQTNPTLQPPNLGSQTSSEEEEEDEEEDEQDNDVGIDLVSDSLGTIFHVNDPKINVLLEDGQHYQVSEQLLRKASPYFSAGLNNWMEGEKREFKMPGCDGQTFDCFLHFVCAKELPHSIAGKPIDDDGYISTSLPDQNDEAALASLVSSRRGLIEAQVLLVKLWALADMLLLPALQNVAMKSLVTYVQRETACFKALHAAFTRVSSSSLLVECLLASAQWGISRSAKGSRANEVIREIDMIYFEKLGRLPGFMRRWGEVVLMSCDTSTSEYDYGTDEATYQVYLNLNVERYLVPVEDRNQTRRVLPARSVGRKGSPSEATS